MSVEMPRAASSSANPDRYMCSLEESSPFHRMTHGTVRPPPPPLPLPPDEASPQVRGERGVLIRHLDPGGGRVGQRDRLGQQVEAPLVDGHPLRRVATLHPLGVQQVVRRPTVLLARGPGVPGLLVRHGLRLEIVHDDGPGAQELPGARVGALRRDLTQRPAGAIHLVDESAAVQRRHHGEVPHVVAGKVLEHSRSYLW